MTSEELTAYFDLASTLDVEGDIVECGVLNGETLTMAAQANRGRRVWAYDSFEGFPKGNPYMDDEVALGLAGSVKGDPALVRASVEPHARELIIREGWFDETFAEPLPEKIAWLSVDCDLYDSVLLTLCFMAPRVVDGGIITLDDWGAFIGCRRAFYEWRRLKRRSTLGAPLLRTFAPHGAVYWRVGE